MLEDKLNYLSILSIGSDITKLLSCEEVNQRLNSANIRGNLLQKYVGSKLIKYVIFPVFIIFLSILKCIICCAFSHSKHIFTFISNFVFFNSFFFFLKKRTSPIIEQTFDYQGQGKDWGWKVESLRLTCTRCYI